MSIVALPQLPNELLSQIFLHVDPHTLYTSIRCLSLSWKEEVENKLIKKEFTSGRWRIGLRVNRKPKVGKAWRGGIAGEVGDQGPGAVWDRISRRVDLDYAEVDEAEQIQARGRAREEHKRSLLDTEDVLEDEMTILSSAQASGSSSHVLPLQFDYYDSETAMLRFDTGNKDWYALFEGAEEGSNSRLDLDFSIVWRFPGDGQSDDELDGWGMPDQENGWLSRFFCSSFDVRTEEAHEQGMKILHSTPLARRIRKRIQPKNEDAGIIAGPGSLDWSDQGHEYMSLCLSLGTEFFVRRSAQANILMRRLEAAALADEEQRRFGKGKAPRRRIPASRATSVTTTPRSDTPRNITRQRHLADPFHRLHDEVISTASCSGSQTPSSRHATYASIASTPCSGASSPKVGLFASSKGPRIAKLSISPSHIRAPHSSANVSGYTSVLHRPKVDGKAIEKSEEESDLEEHASDTLLGCSRADTVDCSGTVQSCPRAFFSAQLFTINMEANCTPQWKIKDPLLPYRFCEVNSDIPLTTWQWSR